MSAANSGTLPRPVIIKSYAITNAIADQTDTDMFTLVVPALTGYSYTGNGPMFALAAAGQSVVSGGLFTKNVDNSLILPASPLFVLNNCVPQVLNPQASPITISGFIYNPSSADITIKFTINVNVSAGVSSVSAAGLVRFVPVAVNGYTIA